MRNIVVLLLALIMNFLMMRGVVSCLIQIILHIKGSLKFSTTNMLILYGIAAVVVACLSIVITSIGDRKK